MKNKRNIDNDCEKATFLIEKKQFDTISLEDAVDLEIHLAGCGECRIFQKQSEIINTTCRQILNEHSYAPLQLDGTFKAALQTRINKAIEEE